MGQSLKTGVGRFGGLAGLALLAGCDGPQSALVPAGDEAARVADLFWVMLTGAVVVWLVVMGLFVYAVRLKRAPHTPVLGARIIGWGGVALPIVLLGALLAVGLALMPALRAPGDGLVVAVSGEQWWWRVAYRTEAGVPVDSANEIRLPLGRRTTLELTSPDVIHSLWIPSLAGKMDMIPGRTTRLVIEPTRTGIFRGACAEYCGTSHALMAFQAVVMEPEDFDAWLAREAAPAGPSAEPGAAAFLANGCGACHAVRGTPATGRLGPDLTHLGSRESLAAGILPNDVGAIGRFVAHAGLVKPEARMPPFDMLPPDEITAIAAYLEGLK